MKKETWLHDIEVALFFGSGVWAGAQPPYGYPWLQGIGAALFALLFFRIYPHLYALVGRLPFLRDPAPEKEVR